MSVVSEQKGYTGIDRRAGLGRRSTDEGLELLE